MLLRDMALHLLFEFNLRLYGWCAMTKVTIDRELLPCPFCGGDQNAAPEHQHNPGCYFDVLASFKVAAANNADLSLAPEVLKAWNRRAALSAQQPDPWAPSGTAYDPSIHSNPDAKAWADFFVAVFPGQADKHELMIGWFANAMMAMHDHLKAQQPAHVSVPMDLLERLRDLSEYWFSRESRASMSETEYKTWHALGFGSSAYNELRALLNGGEA